MARKTYDEDELAPKWKEARQKALLRSKAKNNSDGSYNNIKRNSVYLAVDFQSLGVMGPDEITTETFSLWIDGMRNGNFRTKALASGTIKKRVETLRAILQASHLNEVLEFVGLWKPDREYKKITYWSIEELEAMNECAIKMFEDEMLRNRAMAHLIHSMMAPRISDSSSFKWEYIDLESKIMRFLAQKNTKPCWQFIEERFLPFLIRYKEWVSQFDGGEEYLFPASILHKSGTTRKKIPHATTKTITKWLKQVRDSTYVDGNPVQSLSSHSYRHSLAMRYLSKGAKFENIAMVLGDEIATIEKHYSELIPSKSQKVAFDRAFELSNTISSEETIQPKWLKRQRGLNSNQQNRCSTAYDGFELERGGGRWGI